ncbi:MAG: NAD(P)/FAD-dependent oxidoreductase [Bacteroidota bacterium]
MNSQTLETDYLIVGSGAVGMAFADVILTETDADIIMVDQYAKAGGHWNVAYPFVTLHQPSAYYGVSSLELSKGRIDQEGLNKGLGELASGAEICAYFDEVMRHHFLPTGRLRYFPKCTYQGEGRFVSDLHGKSYQVQVRKKTVDATYLKTSVPSTHTPNFSIAEGVHFMPLNDLPKVQQPPEAFVIIGGGKTGIDACIWLLEQGIDPDQIQWIVSRDAWLIDRKNTQPSPEFFADSIGGQAAQFEAVAQASSIEDLFDRLENAGVLIRIDQTVKPTMFHGATISQLELAELRRIKNVIRLGRVQRIESDRIVLEKGEIPTSAERIHVDCSASAITNLDMKPIFAGNLITPQTVRSYQPVFSAAFVAHIEATFEDEKQKNELCKVVPLPNHDTDWIRALAVFMTNQYNWGQNKNLRQWLRNNRLDGFSQLTAKAKEDPAKLAIMNRIRANVMPAMMKLQQFIAQLDKQTT